MSATKNYLVTGANSGLGLDASRQLSLLPDTKMVYMACRTESKALKAIDDIVRNANAPNDKLKFIKFDSSSTKQDIQQVIDDLAEGEKLDGLILNAGGMGHDTSGKAAGPNNVVDMYQINLIGHIHLVDVLQEKRYLQEGCRIVFSGSEAARGVPLIGIKPPRMPDDLDSYKSELVGSSTKKFDPERTYSFVKGFANLYFAAWARLNPDMTVLSVSPGGTKGTSFASQGSVPLLFQLVLPYLMFVLGLFGYFHNVDVGAKRYVDAVTAKDEYGDFASGTFVASKSGVSGPVSDQSSLEHGSQYADERKQELCYEAIRLVV